jgi:hypothetical protein
MRLSAFADIQSIRKSKNYLFCVDEEKLFTENFIIKKTKMLTIIKVNIIFGKLIY